MAKVKITGHASGSGVLTITAPNTSTDRTVTLPDSTGTLLDTTSGLDATKLSGTLPALNGASLTGVAGRRNMIINGAMNVAQRGTTFAAITDGAYSLDRWKFYNGSIGAYTVTQDSNGSDGFANSLKIDCTTADASPSANDYLILRYTFEGHDLQCLKKGTASAESITFSFWVKSNKTGGLAVHLFDSDNSRGIGSAPTINSADTWEKKTITFAGDTTGAFNDDHSASLYIDIWFDGGSTFTGGSTPTSWEAVADADRGAGTTLDLADSTSNYLNITGVQLELGSVATDFEYRSHGEELQLCKRYFQTIGGSIANEPLCVFTVWSGPNNYGVLKFPVEMRGAPSSSTTGDTSWTLLSAAYTAATTAVTVQSHTEKGVEMIFTRSGNFTNGASGWVRGTTATKISLSAEI